MSDLLGQAGVYAGDQRGEGGVRAEDGGQPFAGVPVGVEGVADGDVRGGVTPLAGGAVVFHGQPDGGVGGQALAVVFG